MSEEGFYRELSRQSGHASLSSRDLQGLAKKASAMFLHEHTPLGDAVVKVAADCRGITNQHVRRVVEMANQATYQNLFEKQAGNKNVVFDIADPDDVLHKLNLAAEPEVMKVASDYAAPPKQYGDRTQARIKQAEADIALLEMFGYQEKDGMILDPQKGQAALDAIAHNEQVAKANKKVIETLLQPPKIATPPPMDGMGGAPAAQGMGGAQPVMPEAPPTMPKMASLRAKLARAKVDGEGLDDLEDILGAEKVKQAAASPESDGMHEVFAAKDRLQSIWDRLVDSHDENDFRLKTAREDFQHHVLQHVMEGGNLGQVAHIIGGMAVEKVANEAMEGLSDKLAQRSGRINLTKLASDGIAYEMANSGRMRAVNMDHPVAKSFAGFAKLAQVQEDILDKMGEVEPVLKEAQALVTLIHEKTRV